MPIRIAFDVETRDPDDVLTLCLVATHPRLELSAVTLTPGTPAQLGLVRLILRQLGVDVPVGAREPKALPKQSHPEIDLGLAILRRTRCARTSRLCC
jgi:hypothetical protein